MRLQYARARTAAIVGDPERAAQLLSALADGNASPALRRRAIDEAIDSGRGAMAVSLARGVVRRGESLSLSGRLLLVADSLARGAPDDAVKIIEMTQAGGADGFIAPFVRAWARVGTDPDAALAMLGRLSPSSPLDGYREQQRALLLLASGRAAEAEAPIVQALARAGGRSTRLRIGFADGMAAGSRRKTALALVEGEGVTLARARAALATDGSTGLAMTSPAAGFVDLLLALALDLNRGDDRSTSLAFAQVARTIDRSSESSIIVAALLGQAGRPRDGLAILRAIPANDPLKAEAMASQVRLMVAAGQLDEATATARALAALPGAGPAELTMLADMMAERDDHAGAAQQYGRALAAAASQGPERRWPLMLYRATQLEAAGDWAAAKAQLLAALVLAPDQPVLLNSLGYGMLERGEDLPAAAAMVDRAAALAPDDASIADSKGWAQFKLGKVDAAIATLQDAAARDPSQAEIHEHLGDALFSAGRRFEARYAWRAAALTAEADAARRLEAKLDIGLTPANAAP